MKKGFGKIMSAVLCAAIVAMAGGACGRNKDMTNTLVIGNFNGGVGVEWLNALAREFTEEYPGVTVDIRNQREQYNGDTLLSTISHNEEVLYFTTEVSYEQLSDQGLLEDITEAVKDPIPVGSEMESSIEEKMFDSLKPYFNRQAGSSSERRYYAVPFFTAVYGIVYDRDLFESKNLLATASNGLGYETLNIDGKSYAATVGPDFVAGNADDGLPRTFEDFLLLMKNMRTRSIIPFTWAGTGYEYYRRAFERACWAAYEGYNDYMLNYSFDGTDGTFGKIDDTNGYKLQGQQGKLAAVKMAKEIANNTDNYASSVFNTTQSHVAAHDQFLLSRFKGGTTKPIGMMLEGGWWENETRDSGTFREMVTKYGPEADYGTRDFRFMQLPKFIGTEGIADQGIGENTLYSDGNTMSFISANALPSQKDWAKKFLQFAHRNSSLSEFTRITGVEKPYTYTLSDSDYNSMTEFSKSVWDVFSSPNMKLTTTYNVSKLRFKNTSAFGEWDFGATIENVSGDASDPLQFYSPIGGISKDGNKNISAEAYFAGMSRKFSKTWWEGLSR